MVGSSKAKKQKYDEYKLNNTVYKNKLKKLKRHVKSHPEDKEGQKNLERIEAEGYKGRKKPLVPGSNRTVAKPKTGYLHYPDPSRTAGEQLAVLLGIALPKQNTSYRRNKKPTVSHKKRRNVKKSKKIS